MIRLRAVLIGLVAVAALGIVTPFCDLLWIGSLIGATYMPVGAIFLFFFFVFILNTILKALKIPFSSAELLLIYAMMAVAAGIPSFGFSVHLIPIITAPFYYATPTNRYAEILHPLIPKWTVPKNPDTIKWLYEGLPQGTGIPYRDWVGPLFWWTLLALAIYLVMFCLSIIVRKQWVENERLVFPLAHLPVDMVKEEGSGSPVPPFFKNRLMWIAFLIPVIVYSIKALHFYFPIVPGINLDFRMEKFFTEKPWNSLSVFWLKIYFCVLGFMYLIPTTLSFSIWFFYLLFQMETVIGATMGFPMPDFPGAFIKAFHSYQVAGGIIALAVLLFWAMRHELKQIFVRAWSTASSNEDRKEALNLRLALLGLVGGFLFICFWAMTAGVRFWAIFVWALIFFFVVIVTTRIVAEGGVFYIHHEFYPLELIMPFTGSAAMGTSSIPMLAAFNQIFAREFRVSLMPFFLNNIKIAEVGGVNKKKLFISMWLAILVILVVSYVTILNLMYKFGGVNLLNWFTNYLPNQLVAARAAHYISSPVLPNLKDAMTMVAGAGIVTFLFWMTRIFLWWPFHPLGYIVGGGYAGHHLWFSTMLGWLSKTLILKLGGIKVYQKLMPLFMGLILGEFVIIGAWVIVDLITGAKGNFLMWI